MWTRFCDTHSGGSQKEQWSHIYIEAPEKEARDVFYKRFGHSADHVTCSCCGEDYSVREYTTIDNATIGPMMQVGASSVKQYCNICDVLIIAKHEAECITVRAMWKKQRYNKQR